MLQNVGGLPIWCYKESWFWNLQYLICFQKKKRIGEQQDKRTLLKNFTLSYNDFEVITDVVHVLAPFKVGQEALEDEIYVNLSYPQTQKDPTW